MSIASPGDKTLAWVGWISSILTGFAMPAFVFLMGDIIDAFDPSMSAEDTIDEITKLVYIMLGLGVITWIFSYLTFALLLIFSEVVAFKTRVRYLEAILT